MTPAEMRESLLFARDLTRMNKNWHELRDPIHVFVRLSSDERKVLNSRPFQRLRHIHQLALTYLVYPGATHRRFEHSLGVMEVAGRIFDVITDRDHVSDRVKDLLPEIGLPSSLGYWRCILRMAALCHDIGHLPFSHAAEDELLPEGWDHERLTLDLIHSPEMLEIWESMSPPLRPDHLAKIAIGPKKMRKFRRDLQFSAWETLLSEVIVGDAFGADRMDYLLRDSHHTGVGYGRFDHHRLIDTLRVLPWSPSEEIYPVAVLGIEQGGLQSAEALLLARYFMYSQLYLHRVRRIYDIHLKDFLRNWLPGGKFSTRCEDLLFMTDNEVSSAIAVAAGDPDSSGHEPARRIVRRQHFKVLYERHPDDVRLNPESGSLILAAAREHLGEENVRGDRYTLKSVAPEFPIAMANGSTVNSLALSGILEKMPPLSIEYVFVEPGKLSDARRWLVANKDAVIRPLEESEA